MWSSKQDWFLVKPMNGGSVWSHSSWSAEKLQIGSLGLSENRCNVIDPNQIHMMSWRVDFLKGRISFQPWKVGFFCFNIGSWTFDLSEPSRFISRLSKFIKVLLLPFPQISWRFFEDLFLAASRNPPKSRPLTLAQNLGREIWGHRASGAHGDSGERSNICHMAPSRRSPLTAHLFFRPSGASRFAHKIWSQVRWNLHLGSEGRIHAHRNT